MSTAIADDSRKVTTHRLYEMKQRGEKIAMLTAYDYSMAQIIDRAGMDVILVGDSASNVMAGNKDTLPISIDQMIYHAAAVARACEHCLVVCDMPFGSYQVSRSEGVRNAIRIMKETGVDALKMEGGIEIMDTVRGIIEAGIPVMGHLGLTPQSVHKFGGYGLRAKEAAEAERLLADARALDEAGCFAITLEKVPAKLAAEVTKAVSCATIGIGAGHETDGQILVYADALGMTRGFKPKFLRHFADVNRCMTDGVQEYIRTVKDSSFPSVDESY